MEKIKDTATAIIQFEEAAIRHTAATEEGKFKTGNECYKIIAAAAAFLKEQKETQLLTGLLNHSSIGVRIWAATYLLPVLESEGLRILKQIAEAKGALSFTAEITISEWEKGNLRNL